MTKQYTSEIGKLYKQTQEDSYLQTIVTDLYGSFEAEIKFGDKLPITIKNKYGALSEDEIFFVIKALREVGCIVEHSVRKSCVQPREIEKHFTLIDLL